MLYLDWLSSMFVWIPASFVWRCGLSNLLLWNVSKLERICYRNLAPNRQNRTKGAPEEAKIGPKGVLPRGSKKQVAKKTRWCLNSSSKWLQNGSPKLTIRCILCNIFWCFSVSFAWWFSIGFFDHFESILASFLWFFKNWFETNWFVWMYTSLAREYVF